MSTSDTEASDTAAPDQSVAARRPSAWRAVLGTPGTLTAAGVIVVIVLIALLAPIVWPNADTINAGARLESPSGAHWFGTDELGRDLLARMAHATQLTLLIALGAMALSVVLGVVWGMVAAAFGSWVEEILMRTADAIMAVPMILFALVFVAALGSNPIVLIVILGIIKSPLVARVTRSSTMVELTSDYVRGLTVVGLGRSRILFREVLPNVFPVIAAVATLNIASAIMVEASLSFIGLGVQPPLASLGTLLKIGYSHLPGSWWYALFPALAITVIIAAFNVIGKRLERYLDRRSA
ncbi:ABC transporter permease [Nakamurella lactea]|uniref:ABC transporter permease n=1 Tax=Nakamurella lactea TaxID=459515 RepID=UPI0003FA2F22|nr:ABC transporter permease [Nakamurella lactea]